MYSNIAARWGSGPTAVSFAMEGANAGGLLQILRQTHRIFCMTKQSTFRAAVAVMILGGLASSAMAQPPQLYDLNRTPRFDVGDTVMRITAETYRSLFTDKQGEPTREKRLEVEATEVQKVTRTSEAGQVIAFVDHLTSAKMKSSYRLGTDMVDQTTIELSDVTGRAGRVDAIFQVDPDTLASQTVESLAAPQVALLKRFFHERMAFHAFRETTALLMPTKPVAVGGKWRPAPPTLLRWCESLPSLHKIRFEQPAGEFKLVSVKDGVAMVRGRITFGLRIGTAPAKAQIVLSGRIDLPSGRWRGETVISSLKTDIGGLRFLTEATATATMIYTPASEQATATEPEQKFSLGWPAAGPDTNSFRSLPDGVSLDAPITYRQVTLPKPAPVVAEFVGENGRRITLMATESHRPMTLDQMIPRAVAELSRAIRDYVVLEQRRVQLADGVPAVMITASSEGGSRIIVTLIAIDSMRLVNVSATSRGSLSSHGRELQQIVQSLRVFEPDFSEVPIEPAP